MLIDWKQTDQDGYGEGLALSQVRGDIPNGNTAVNPAWSHTGIVDLKTRSNAPGAQYASTGWLDFTTYNFALEFTATNIKVFIDGLLEIDYDAVGGTFADGGFGFYNYSQDDVLYADLQQIDIPNPSAVPLPAALPLLIAGLGGLSLMRRRRKGV